MKKVAIVACLFFVGCANVQLAPTDLRARSYVAEHRLKKQAAYDKTLAWFARSFANSNEVLRLTDRESGRIIAKGNVECDALGLGNGYAPDQRLWFTLETVSADNKTDIVVSEIVGKTVSGAWDSHLRPSNKVEADRAFDACVTPFVDRIKADLN